MAPDHRRAHRALTRISIEQANRTPAVFFGSGTDRRVYMPTDELFVPGRAQLTSEADLALSRLAALLALHPERPVVIEVHTDAGGDGAARQALSDRRADAVGGWLVERGHLDPSRFAVVGLGARHPLLPPDGSWAAQEPNRRLEVRLAD